MRERDVEKYLVDRVKALGGEVRKLQWVGRSGAPDRLVMLFGPHFVELKRPGEKLKDHQAREHERMKAQGLSVRTLDHPYSIELFLMEITI